MGSEKLRTGVRSMAAVWWAFTLRDFRGKYAASLMGAVWAIVNPLLLLAVFTFVFTAIFRIRLGAAPGFADNALYIFTGILPWMAFQEAVQRSATVLIENKNMVTRVRFPSGVLPAAVVGSSLIGFAIGLLVLFAAAFAVNGYVPPTALLLPLVIVFQILFTAGVAWFVSSVNVFFRDLQQLIPVGLMVWMWATPIFYSPEMAPEKITIGGIEINHARMFLALNPMSRFIAMYRAIILEGVLPSGGDILFAALFSLSCLIVGGWCFRHGASKFADVL